MTKAGLHTLLTYVAFKDAFNTACVARIDTYPQHVVQSVCPMLAEKISFLLRAQAALRPKEQWFRAGVRC